MNAWVYILKCADNKFYAGSSTDIDKRLVEHETGVYSGFTKKRFLLVLAFSQRFSTIEDAIRAEKMTKGWTRKKKEAQINFDFDLLHKLAKCTNRTLHQNY